MISIQIDKYKIVSFAVFTVPLYVHVHLANSHTTITRCFPHTHQIGALNQKYIFNKNYIRTGKMKQRSKLRAKEIKKKKENEEKKKKKKTG